MKYFIILSILLVGCGFNKAIVKPKETTMEKQVENKMVENIIQTKTNFPLWIKAKCFLGLHYWLRYSWDGKTYRCMYCNTERKGRLTDVASLWTLFFVFISYIFCTVYLLGGKMLGENG